MSEMQGSARRLLLVGGDLMARARVEQVAAGAGIVVELAAPGSLAARLTKARDVDLVVLDLDSGGRGLLDEVASAGVAPETRVVGYFSHVDASLGEAARRAGCEALPRGRFWRTLPELLRGESKFGP
jgi:hypothetical protein